MRESHLSLVVVLVVLVGSVAGAQTVKPKLGSNLQVTKRVPKYNGHEVGSELLGLTPVVATLSIRPAQIQVPGSGGFASDFIMSMVIDPANDQTIYGVTNDSQDKSLRIVYSQNSGASWSILSSLGEGFFDAYQDSTGLHIAVSANAEEIFLASSRGIFISTDHGQLVL